MDPIQLQTEDGRDILERLAGRSLSLVKRPTADGGLKIRTAKDKDTKRGEIVIYEVIGLDWWTGEGMTAKKLRKAVKDMGDVSEIDVRINSPGGLAFDGIAIYNVLAQHSAKIIVHIDGLAASAASLISMAGDEIRMAENASMMIHSAASVVWGNAQDMREEADVLEKLDGQIARTYAARAGGDVDEFITLMEEETWFDADEAVERGLATEVTEAKKVAAFDLRSLGFRNAPAPAKADSEVEAKPDPKSAEAVAIRQRLVDIDSDGQ